MDSLTITNLSTALAAGVVTFLSPCLLPLLPGWLAFLAGDTAVDAGDGQPKRHRAIVNTLAFVLGFSLVFTLLGLGAAFLGGKIFSARDELELVGGIVIAFFGLLLISDKFLPSAVRGKGGMNNRMRVTGPVSAGVFGVAFATAWSPCIGPTLGAILAIASTTGSAGHGAILLLVFSAGLGIPFIIVALGADRLLPKIRKLNQYSERIRIGAGVILLIFGVLLATGVIGSFSNDLSQFVPFEI